VVLAGSVDLPRRTAPTVEPLFACLAPNSARIGTGLARARVRAALVAVDARSVTLKNADQVGKLLADALQEPVALPTGIPRIIAYDQDSPLDVVLPAVRAVLVAHLSRRTPQASSAAIAEQAAPWLTAYGKRARHVFRQKVEAALRQIAADEPALFEYRGPTANHDPLVRFLSTPEDNDPRGRTQAYQALARPAHTRRRSRPAENPAQLDLLDELQEADDVVDIDGGDIEDGWNSEEGGP